MATDLSVRNDERAASVIGEIVAGGDLEKLTTQQRATYVLRLCESLGLNPLSKPFQFIKLQQRLTLYATKDATDQLRQRRDVTIAIVGRERIDDVYVVTARASLRNGRSDEEIGAVPIKGLSGEALANALMKAQTKAKRRVTLSICGLGMLDETELETIPAAHVAPVPDALPEPAADASAQDGDDDGPTEADKARVEALARYQVAYERATERGAAEDFPAEPPASYGAERIHKGAALLEARAAK